MLYSGMEPRQSVQTCFISVHSLRSAGCIHTVYTVSWYAVHRRACQVCLPTAEPCAKMKPEKKLLFLLLVSHVTFLLPS